MNDSMTMRELTDAVEKVRGETGDEAIVTRLRGSDLHIIAYVLRQSGIREPESQTWDLVRGVRIA